MKVFVSSLIAGMEPIRLAAREAITTLRHAPVMAEDFGAQLSSPQIACLTGLRGADVVVLILGDRYGAQLPSGLSATHEEYRDAQGRKPVIAFVQAGVTREPLQSAFVEEVQGWEGGLFRGAFTDAVDLQKAITRALHDYELANAVGPVDEAELVTRTSALLPAAHRNSYSGSALSLAVAGGPTRQIIRPVEIEDHALWEAMHQAAMFGETRVFDQAKGVEKGIEGASLVLKQEGDSARVQLDEQAGLLIHVAMDRSSRRGGAGGLPVLLEEDVHQQLAAALAYAAWLLERIDSTQKLTHLAVAAQITGGEYLAWRTQAENAASPNSISMGMGRTDRPAVHLSKPRAALRLQSSRLIEDLLVPLRRQWKR